MTDAEWVLLDWLVENVGEPWGEVVQQARAGNMEGARKALRWAEALRYMRMLAVPDGIFVGLGFEVRNAKQQAPTVYTDRGRVYYEEGVGTWTVTAVLPPEPWFGIGNSTAVMERIQSSVDAWEVIQYAGGEGMAVEWRETFVPDQPWLGAGG